MLLSGKGFAALRAEKDDIELGEGADEVRVTLHSNLAETLLQLGLSHRAVEACEARPALPRYWDMC